MSNVKADITNNILHIKIIGVITGESAKMLKTKITEEIQKILPGFDIITDMSQFRLGNADALAIAQNIFRELLKMKVGRIVRVVGNSQNAVVQSSAATSLVDGYQVKYVPTLADAYKYLDKTPEK